MNATHMMQGRYLTLTEEGRYLRVTLTDEGREELADYDVETSYDAQVFPDLFEDFMGNDWEMLAPEDIGALTSCPIIISPDVTRDEDGTVTASGDVYWHERYQVEDFVSELLAGSALLWKV